MKNMVANVAMIWLACLNALFLGGANSLATAQDFPHLPAERAIAAARRNAKPESSVTLLSKVIANADMWRIGIEAFEQEQTHKIEPFENGMLVNILRSGSYLFAETDPRTNNVVATHFVLMEAGGAVKDVESPCHGAVKLADAEELVKDTAELVRQMYFTLSTEESSLANRFDGGTFPDANLFPDSMFITPASLQKLGAKPNEVREAAALFWGYLAWPSRYALSMPAFSASPAAAADEAQKEQDRF